LGLGALPPFPALMKKYLILLIAALITVPISSAIQIIGQPTWYVQWLVLTFWLFFGVSLVLWKFNKFVSIFTLFALLSTYFVVGRNPRAVMLLFQLELTCLASYGVSKFKKKDRKFIIYTILVLVLIQYSWLIVQTHNLDPFFETNRPNRIGDELVGFLGNPNQLGTFFAITLPVMLYLYPPLALLSVMGLIVAKTTFAFVAGISAGLFYLFFVKRKLFYISLISGLILSSVFFLKIDRPKAQDFGTRPYVWKHAIETSLKGEIKVVKNGRKLNVETNPIWGYGFGNFIKIFPYVPEKLTKHKFNYINEKFTHAHNDYAEAIFEFGYSGLVLIVCFLTSLVSVFIKTLKTKEFILYSSCVLAYLLNCVGNFCSQLAVSGLWEGTRNGKKR
jgi:O-antigen ligase